MTQCYFYIYIGSLSTPCTVRFRNLNEVVGSGSSLGLYLFVCIIMKVKWQLCKTTKVGKHFWNTNLRSNQYTVDILEKSFWIGDIIFSHSWNHSCSNVALPYFTLWWLQFRRISTVAQKYFQCITLFFPLYSRNVIQKL